MRLSRSLPTDRATRPAARRRLARALESLLAVEDRPRGLLTSAVAPDPIEVRDARPALYAVLHRLESDEPVSARGMQMVRELLIDGNSPLFQPAERGEFGDRLRAAAAELMEG
jgi:hypothetical protein